MFVVEQAFEVHCQTLEKMSKIANEKQPLCIWIKWHCSDLHKTRLNIKRSTMTFKQWWKTCKQPTH